MTVQTVTSGPAKERQWCFYTHNINIILNHLKILLSWILIFLSFSSRFVCLPFRYVSNHLTPNPYLNQVVKVVLSPNPAVICMQTVGLIGDVFCVQTFTVVELPFEQLESNRERYMCGIIMTFIKTGSSCMLGIRFPGMLTFFTLKANLIYLRCHYKTF